MNQLDFKTQQVANSIISLLELAYTQNRKITWRTIFTYLEYPTEAWEDDEDIDEDIDFGVAGGIQQDLVKQMEADMAANAIIQSTITSEKWQIEVERVAHKLKINKAGTDDNAWRSHLDQTKKFAD